jgi:hypothetical protein
MGIGAVTREISEMTEAERFRKAFLPQPLALCPDTNLCGWFLPSSPLEILKEVKTGAGVIDRTPTLRIR